MARTKGAKSEKSASSDRLAMGYFIHHLVKDPKSAPGTALARAVRDVMQDVTQKQNDLGRHIYEPSEDETEDFEGKRRPTLIERENVFVDDPLENEFSKEESTHWRRLWRQIRDKDTKEFLDPYVRYILRRRIDPDFRDFWWRDRDNKEK